MATTTTPTTTTSSSAALLTLRAALRTLSTFTDGRFLIHAEEEMRPYSAEQMERVRALGWHGDATYGAAIYTIYDRETGAYAQVDYVADWSHIPAIEAVVKVRGAALRRWRPLE